MAKKKAPAATAHFQLGDGERTEVHLRVWERRFKRGTTRPNGVRIVASTSGKGRRDFPATIELSRSDALRLISSMAHWLATDVEIEEA